MSAGWRFWSSSTTCTWCPAARTGWSRSTTASRSPRAASTRSRTIRRWSRPTWAATPRTWPVRNEWGAAEPGPGHHVLRPDADPGRDLAERARGRAGLPARRERVRQVDHAEDHPRHRPAALWPGPAGRPGRDAVAGAAAHRDRDRDRTGEPAPVRAADGAGKPRARRGAAPGRVAHRGLRPGARAVPAAARTAQPAGRHAVRRRAADGRDGPGADVAPPAAADGRAVDGAVTRAGPAELPDHQDHPRLRGGGPDGRAERDDGTVHRRPRLCPVDRGDRPRGARRGPAAGRGPQARLSGPVTRSSGFSGLLQGPGRYVRPADAVGPLDDVHAPAGPCPQERRERLWTGLAP